MIQYILDGQAAIHGDEEAARQYCGSYILICRPQFMHVMYRFKGGDPPVGWLKIETIDYVSVYDEDGYLKPQYWALARIDKNGKIS